MGARADRLNRALLTLLGLLLSAAGVSGLLLGSGALGERYVRGRLLSPDFVDFVEDEAPWLWPLLALLALLLALLALRYLLLQLRTDRVDAVDLTERRNRGETRVDAAAVTDALVDAVEACSGVESASARLIRVRRREQLLLYVRLADRADVGRARRELGEGPLTDLRRVLGEAACPQVRVELEPSTKGNGRVLA
jgi:hypothetical protein